MFKSSAIFAAWIRRVQGPFWRSLLAMALVGSVAVTGQWILRAPIAPSLDGLVRVWVGLIPEMTGILAPVSLLFATVTVARLWAEGGEIRGMECSGLSSRGLIPVGLLTGLVVGGGVMVCSHWLTPMGRAAARAAIGQVISSDPLRPKNPVQIGSVWLRAEQVDEGVGRDVVVATDDWLTWAERGHFSSTGLQLEKGRTWSIGGDWSLRFEHADIPIDLPKNGIHNFERSSSSLWSIIHRKESNGQPAQRERITLYKRTTLALSAPFFGVLGIPLGLRYRRPAWVTVGVVAIVWLVQRMGDHFVMLWGPEAMALMPLLILFAVCWRLWSVAWRWS